MGVEKRGNGEPKRQTKSVGKFLAIDLCRVSDIANSKITHPHIEGKVGPFTRLSFSLIER